MKDEEKVDNHTIGYWLQFIKENNDDVADFNFGFSKIIEIAKQLEKENAEFKQKLESDELALNEANEIIAELKMKLLTLENKEQVVTTTVSN